jgi:hypothetical protein
MTQESNNVVCCFCGEGLEINSAVHISFNLPSDPEATQGVFAHPSCFDKILHSSVPRLLDKKEDVD